AGARRAAVAGTRCRQQAEPTEGAATWVLLCIGDEPRALLAFERELGLKGSAPADTPVRVTPYVWRSDGFRPHHVHLEPGELLQIGASADALPGDTRREVT